MYRQNGQNQGHHLYDKNHKIGRANHHPLIQSPVHTVYLDDNIHHRRRNKLFAVLTLKVDERRSKSPQARFRREQLVRRGERRRDDALIISDREYSTATGLEVDGIHDV